MEKETADKILNEIEEGYDLMAGKFSDTRKFFWRGLEFIKDYTKDGDKVLDFGCGNGRLLELLSEKNIKYWGVDISGNLIDIAKKRYYSNDIDFAKIDSSSPTKFTIAESEEESKLEEPVSKNLSNSSSRNLMGDEPFQDDFFNAVYSIAVFHHLPGKKHRKEIAQELYRIAKPGGYIIITVWNLWPASTRGDDRSSTRGGQKKYLKYILKNWFNKLIGKSSLDWNDCYVSFKDNWGNNFNRYHHAFTKRELNRLFSEAGFKKEKCEIIGHRNLVYIGKKVHIPN